MAERVQKGAELLDERVPDWYTKINVEQFRMDSCKKCILGQLFGHFFKGLNKLNRIYNESHLYGFNTYSFNESFDALTIEWIAAIETRLN